MIKQNSNTLITLDSIIEILKKNYKNEDGEIRSLLKDNYLQLLRPVLIDTGDGEYSIENAGNAGNMVALKTIEYQLSSRDEQVMISENHFESMYTVKFYTPKFIDFLIDNKLPIPNEFSGLANRLHPEEKLNVVELKSVRNSPSGGKNKTVIANRNNEFIKVAIEYSKKNTNHSISQVAKHIFNHEVNKKNPKRCREVAIRKIIAPALNELKKQLK